MLLLLTVLPGLAGVGVFGYHALVDWAVFVAEAAQNIHRINLFADGVWALLSAILGEIGLHSLCRHKPAA